MKENTGEGCKTGIFPCHIDVRKPSGTGKCVGVNAFKGGGKENVPHQPVVAECAGTDAGNPFFHPYRCDGKCRPRRQSICIVVHLSFAADGEDAVCKCPAQIIPAYPADRGFGSFGRGLRGMPGKLTGKAGSSSQHRLPCETETYEQ